MHRWIDSTLHLRANFNPILRMQRNCPSEAVQLAVQHRMIPSIADPVNAAIYNHVIANHPSLHSARCRVWHPHSASDKSSAHFTLYRPLTIEDIQDQQTKILDGSSINQVEADTLFMHLTTLLLELSTVCIIKRAD